MGTEREPRRRVELLRHLEGFLANRTTREEIEAWTRRVWPEGGPGTFRCNDAAETVFGAMWNITQHHGDGYLVRACDVAMYLRWLREGPVPIPPPFARTSMGVPAIGKRLGLSSWRYPVEGLGWFEGVLFASPLSGHSYVAAAAMGGASAASRDDEASLSAFSVTDPTVAVRDIFDVFEVDLSDVTPIDPEVAARVAATIDLWRQDDHGVRARVAGFTGRAKAMAALAAFESRGHKQAYWLEGPGQ